MKSGEKHRERVFGFRKWVIKIEQVTTICYGEKQTWQTRKQAMDFFFKAMMESEGSEQNRYATILSQLQLGLTVCNDMIE